MKRSYYGNHVKNFLRDSDSEILGKLAKNNEFELEISQREAWSYQILLLKDLFKKIDKGYILFEYTIPRLGKRIDNILLYNGIVFLFEFKVGSTNYFKQDIDQVYDYALDLKNFHEESRSKYIVPILVATKATEFKFDIRVRKDMVFEPIYCNGDELSVVIETISRNFGKVDNEFKNWIESRYRPTPTIIEAAQALYKGHKVHNISRSDAGAKNLNDTTDYINRVIDNSKNMKKKSICFLTGVPGAGKTLAGLNIGTNRQKYENEEHAVFLSGNGPLVTVLREALARDENLSYGISMSEARRRTSVFIQNIHHFRDAAIKDNRPPVEKVVVFDEAQRAWDRNETERFMKERGIVLKQSEPYYLISVMDRHQDWACIVCLIGGGQEIYKGEAGLSEWFETIGRFPDWEVHVSNNIIGQEYLNLRSIEELSLSSNYRFTEKLHLSTSIRSFRSEKLSEFVGALLNIQDDRAKELYKELEGKYPIFITRDLSMAKKFLKMNSRGNERYGIVGSSDARRLKAVGLNVKSKIDVEHWFLNGKDDVRSSYYLEDIATEFDIQGLELDWVCVAWGGDFSYKKGQWEFKTFKGTKWQHVNQEHLRVYKKNSYRVLLTRARQGMVIYLPIGDDKDHTRDPSFYNGTYEYLKSLNILELEDAYFKNFHLINDRIDLPNKESSRILDVATYKDSVYNFKRKNSEYLKDKSNNEQKIGLFIRDKMEEISIKNILKDDDLCNLQDLHYSKKLLNINYPLLKKIDRSKSLDEQRLVNSYPRYWKHIFIFNNKEYYVCSQWYEKSNRSYFEQWIKDIIK